MSAAAQAGDGRGRLEWLAAGGLQVLRWQAAGVSAAFPTREGGVSGGPYASLNLGYATGDDPAAVTENRRRLCAALGLDPGTLVVARQVHGDRLCWVGRRHAGRGARGPGDAIVARDGLLTVEPGLPLCVSTADCLPVVIAAADGAFAAVHAGWRGLLSGVVGRAARELARRHGLAAAVVGPSLGPCCFRVDGTLRERFRRRFPGCVAAGAETVDLWALAVADLVAAGLPRDQVTVSGVCTSCDGRFYSYRRDGGLTGRHLAVAWRAAPEAAAGCGRGGDRASESREEGKPW